MAATASRLQATRRRRERITTLKHSINWLYLLPFIIFFVGWQAYPLARVAYLSFTDYWYIRGDPPVFIGLENFGNALVDPVVHEGLLRAGIFTVLFLPGCILLPLAIAAMVDRVTQGRIATFYRIILLIPAMIPGPMVFVMWRTIYNYQIGPLNEILVNILGLYTFRNAPQWLGGGTLTLPAIVVMENWWGLGYHTMFFLAGMATIPRDLYDAAKVDGANEWNTFWRITVPRLRPMLLVLTVLRFGTAMAVIDEYLILGGLVRNTSTYTWTVYMWHLAFQLGDWSQGYASAIGWIGAGAMLVIVAFLFWLFRNRD